MSGRTQAWNRFWFTPESTSTLAVVRIAFGVVLLLWALTLSPDLSAFYTRDGLLPEGPSARWTWGPLAVSSSPSMVLAVFVVMVVAAIGLILGYRTRLASILAFVALLSFERRNPSVLNSGDWLLRIEAFFLMLTPAGSALSLDRRRQWPGRFWEFPRRAPFGLRLIQLQLCAVYFFSVWWKVRGDYWNNGTAISYALRIDDFARVQVPTFISTSELFSNVLTYGTLAVELSIALLVWNRRLRPWVLGVGLLLHLGIDATMQIGFFSFQLFVAYLAFVPGDSMDRFVLAVRDRFIRRRAAKAPHRAPARATG